MTLQALPSVQPVPFSQLSSRQVAKTAVRLISPLAAYEVHRTGSEDSLSKSGLESKTTPSYMTGMTPDDLVNPVYSPLQRWALRSIAWYQRQTRKVDTEGHIHNTHGMCCRFYPSCSTYTAEAIKEYGFVKGVYKGFVRTAIKCNPIQPLIIQYGSLRAFQMTAKSVVGEIGELVGFNLYPTERAQVTEVFNRLAQGEKILDPLQNKK